MVEFDRVARSFAGGASVNFLAIYPFTITTVLTRVVNRSKTRSGHQVGNELGWSASTVWLSVGRFAGRTKPKHPLGAWGKCFRLLTPAIAMVAVLAALDLCGTSASAGEFIVTPGVTVSQTYSDNIDLDPDGLEDDALVTEVIPRIEVRSIGARFEGALDASTSLVYQTDGEDEGLEARPAISGFSTLEISKSLFFFDTQVSVSQELLNSRAADTEANRNTTAAYSLSPYLVNRFGGFAESETRYKFSQVHVDDDAEEVFSNDTTHAGRFTLDSGRDFSRLRWSFLAAAVHQDRSDDSNIQRIDVDQEFEYGVTRSFSLIGAGGYDKFDDGDDENEVDDPSWRAGFRLRSPRGELAATYGQREGDESLAANLRYRIGAWTTVNAGYDETLETGQERVVRNLGFISEDPDTGVLIDTRTGLPFDANPNTTSLTNQTTRTKRFTAGLTFNRGQNTIGIRGSIEDQQDQSSNDDEKHNLVTAFWQRRLNRRTTFRLTGSYENSTFDDEDREDDEYIANALLNYKVRDNVSLFGAYTYRQKDSTDPTDEYEENRFTIGLGVNF